MNIRRPRDLETRQILQSLSQLWSATTTAHDNLNPNPISPPHLQAAAQHNPLSIAMANEDARVAHVVLAEIDQHYWTQPDCRKAVARWVRSTGFANTLALHSRDRRVRSAQLLKMVLPYCVRSLDKTFLIVWAIHYWRNWRNFG